MQPNDIETLYEKGYTTINSGNNDSNLLTNIKNGLIQKIQQNKSEQNDEPTEKNERYNKSTIILLQEKIDLQEHLINNQRYRIEILLSRIDYLEQILLLKEENSNSTHNDNNQEKIDTITTIIQKSVENTQQSLSQQKTLPPPHQPKNTQINFKTGFGTLNKTIGPRLQQINPENLQILKVYEYVGEAITESNNILKRPSIEKSVVECTIYKNFRWAYVPREKDPNVLHELQPTKETKVQNTGYIAKLNSTKTEILNVYLDRKVASKENGYESRAALDNPVKNNTITRNHFYALFRDCDPQLQTNFVEKYCDGDEDKLLLYKDGVGLFDENGTMVCEYASKIECINARKLGDRTLNNCIENNTLYNGVYYRKIGSKLKMI